MNYALCIMNYLLPLHSDWRDARVAEEARLESV